MELKARPGGCEEASPMSHKFYIPCNRPAARMVGWPERPGEPDVRMCEPCAHHNVKNRGATDLGLYVLIPEDVKAIISEPAAEPDLSAYADDAQLSSEETTNVLAKISSTVRELIDAEADVTSAEQQLRTAQDRVRNLKENTLPMLMDEAQQKRLTTLDGYDVTRDEVVRASISAENMPKAVVWLTANGQAAIVKRELKLAFGKGEEQKAAEAFDVLREHSFAPSDKMSVHPQTLGAVVRELLAEGREIPMETLGVFIQPLVKIKRAK